MSFFSLIPDPPLSCLIESVWDYEASLQDHSLERVVPTAGACLIINLAEDETRVYDPNTLHCHRLSGFTLDGPRTRFSIIDTHEQTKVMGVIFRPGGAAQFFRERFDCLLNQYIDAADVLGGSKVSDLRERLLAAANSSERLAILNAWLIGHALHAADPSALLVHALTTLERMPQVDRIADLAKACDVSARHLRELFDQQVGMSPKSFVRLQRFHRVLSKSFRHRDVEWAAIAADCGFYDQSHMIHEFQTFCGMTPNAYLALRGAHRNHMRLV